MLISCGPLWCTLGSAAASPWPKAARGLWALLLVGRDSLGGEHTASLLPREWLLLCCGKRLLLDLSTNLLASFCYFIVALLGVKFFCLNIPFSLVFGKHLHSWLDTFYTKDVQRPPEKVYLETWAWSQRCPLGIKSIAPLWPDQINAKMI